MYPEIRTGKRAKSQNLVRATKITSPLVWLKLSHCVYGFKINMFYVVPVKNVLTC